MTFRRRTRSQPPPTRRGQANATAEAGMRHGLASLDAVNLQASCRQLVLTLQSALRASAEHCAQHCAPAYVSLSTPEDAARGWRLFCLAPRMLLFRLPGESRIPSARLGRRFKAREAKGTAWDSSNARDAFRTCAHRVHGQPNAASPETATGPQLGLAQAAPEHMTAE